MWRYRVVLKNEQGHGMEYFITDTIFKNKEYQMVVQVALSFLASMLVIWFSPYFTKKDFCQPYLKF